TTDVPVLPRRATVQRSVISTLVPLERRHASSAMRSLRVLAIFGLVVLFALIVTLAVTPLCFVRSGSGWVALGLVVLAPVVLGIAARRRQWRAWTRIGASYLVFVPVLAYLAIDDADLRHPITLEEFAPAFPGAEKSYDVLMRYGRAH